ncbi:MAG: hypothetical protein GC171_02880 [Terrimonas sp.]|nr:hypothetical protein [Terrimonas sp.]
MKLLFGSALLLLVACNNAEDKATNTMPGAYKMISNSAKNDKMDTTVLDGVQMKIYTEDYMMYANVNPADSVSAFGIGSYSVDKDTVTENVIFNAWDSAVGNPGTFKLIIEKTDKGYKQVINNMTMNNGDAFQMTEDYQSVGTDSKSALDGAWKMTKRMIISGTDTTDVSSTQYKTFYAGHVIWGHTWTDSLNKTHTGMGFGTFTLNDNKLKESMTASTYAAVKGHDFDIDITMNGADGFTQTMANNDGTKSIEVYERMKK